MRAVGVGEVIGIVDTSATVMVGVHEDNNVFVGCASQHVVQFFQVEGSQVAVTIESVEIGTEGRVLPDTFRRPAGTAFL